MTNGKPNFEIANSDDPADIAMATKRSLIAAMRDVLAGLAVDTGAPGLTWDQINYLLDGFDKKQPTIIHQEGEF